MKVRSLTIGKRSYEARPGGWVDFLLETLERIEVAISNPGLVFYFMLACLVSFAGVAPPFLRDDDSDLVIALISSALSFSALSGCLMALAQGASQNLKTFNLLLIFVAMGSSAYATYTASQANFDAWTSVFLSVGIGLFLAFLALSENTTLQEPSPPPVDPVDSVGGEIADEIEDSGSSEYET